MAHDVFISYSSKDANVAHAVCARFEASGVRCWYAPRNIAPGAEWASSIMDALKEARVMVLLFTDYSNASVQVRREVDNAISSGVTIIPFKLTENAPSGGMKYYLSTLHWLDALNKPLETAIDELLELVRLVLEGREDASWHPGPAQGSGPAPAASGEAGQPIRAGKKSGAAKVFRIIGAVFLLAIAALLLITFFSNPTLRNAIQIIILGIGLIPLFIAANLIWGAVTPAGQKVRRLTTWLACGLMLVFSVVGYIVVEGRAPSNPTLADNGPEISMNMMNYSMAVRTSDDTVYYADTIDGIPGIYRAPLADFRSGADGECLLSGVAADNLVLCGNRLVYRDIDRNRMNMWSLDLTSGNAKLLKRNNTGWYYASHDWVMFNFTGSVSNNISIITADGSYETSYLDEYVSYLCCYEGRPYYLSSAGVLSTREGSLNTATVSNDVRNYFMICDDVVYFVGADGYGLYRAPLDDPADIEKLTSDTPSGMVVHDGWLYFLNQNDNNALCRIPVTGGETETVTPKSYTAVNIIGDCLYLDDAGDSYARIPLD